MEDRQVYIVYLGKDNYHYSKAGVFKSNIPRKVNEEHAQHLLENQPDLFMIVDKSSRIIAPKTDKICSKVKEEFVSEPKVDEPVSIIIPVFNALDYLKKCIRSVREYTKNYELIIIDNGSNKQTKRYIKRLKKNVTIITNDRNKGFAYACNQGLKVAKHKYYCLLNTDTLVTPGWLEKMLKAMRLPNAGIVGPSTWRTNHRPQGLIGLDDKDKPKKQLRDIDKIPEDDITTDDLLPLVEALEEKYIETDNIMGFCYLIRQEVIDKIGVMDHRSFPVGGGDEVDYNRRAREVGFKLYVARQAYVHHFRHKTIKNMGINLKSNTHSYIKAQNRNIALNKIFIPNDVRVNSGITKFDKVVVTANMGGNDSVKTDHYNNPDFDFYLFTDIDTDNNKWNVKVVRRQFKDARREARMYKWLIHKFVDAKYSLWIDGSVTIETDINELIKKYLSDADMAIHLHGDRQCIYEEAKVCSDWGFDYLGVIEDQIIDYKKEGYPKDNGLFETTVVLRRHTKKINRFNEAVWAQICSGSVRDQLSVNYWIWKMRLKVNPMEGTFKAKNTKFKTTGHLKNNRKYGK